MRGNLIMVCFGVGRGGWVGEDNGTSEAKDGRDGGVFPALRLSPLLQISVFVLAFSFPLPISRVTLTPSPRAKRKRLGASLPPSPLPPPSPSTLTLFFRPSIFHSRGDILSAIFPAPSHSPSWPRAIRGGRRASRVARWGRQRSRLYGAVCGWMGQNRAQTNGRR